MATQRSSKKAIWGPVVIMVMEDGEGCKRMVMLRMVSPIDLRAAALPSRQVTREDH